MRIGQGNIDGAELDGMIHLAPVRGDHVGGGRQAGGAPELRHDLAAGEALLGPARILRIGQDVAPALAEGDRFLQRPGAVGVEGDARLRETLVDRRHRRDLVLAGKDAAFQLEVVEAVGLVGRLGEARDRVRGQGLLVPQAEPAVAGVGRAVG
jgi:hypothetical protein